MKNFLASPWVSHANFGEFQFRLVLVQGYNNFHVLPNVFLFYKCLQTSQIGDYKLQAKTVALQCCFCFSWYCALLPFREILYPVLFFVFIFVESMLARNIYETT